MGTAIRSDAINIEDRIELLKASYEIFKTILDSVEKNANNALFPQDFTAGSLGTLFGNKHFLHRLINTCVGLAIGMKLGITDLATQRIGTHDLECFFGYMRLASSYNHTLEQAIRACINSIILKIESQKMNQKIHIRSRDNIGGVVLTKSMNQKADIAIDWLELHEIISELLLGKQISQEKEKNVKDISKKIIEIFDCERINIPTLFAGFGPTDRNIRYTKYVSYMPIRTSDVKSPFDFFMNKQRYVNIMNTNEFKKWTCTVIKKVVAYADEMTDMPVHATKEPRRQQLIQASMKEYDNLMKAISFIIRNPS